MRHVVLKNHPQQLTEYEGKGTKISICKLFSELGKIWKCNLRFSKIQFSHLFYALGKTRKYTHSPRPTYQNQHFESIDELGKVMS